MVFKAAMDIVAGAEEVEVDIEIIAAEATGGEVVGAATGGVVVEGIAMTIIEMTTIDTTVITAKDSTIENIMEEEADRDRMANTREEGSMTKKFVAVLYA